MKYDNFQNQASCTNAKISNYFWIYSFKISEDLVPKRARFLKVNTICGISWKLNLHEEKLFGFVLHYMFYKQETTRSKTSIA